jgi:hypothetical protein
MVVCEDDGILYGHGESEKAAWENARRWVEDAFQYQLQCEFQAQPSSVLTVDLCFKVYPCTKRLAASLDEQGGHENWHVGEGGVLDLGKKKEVVTSG